MKKFHFFAYLARMRFITRWALMRNSIPENVQEHSHMVAILAHALAVIHNRVYGGHVDEGKVTLVALYHDASEILTGDMPTPIKYANPLLRDTYRQVETAAEEKLLSMLPSEMQSTYQPILQCEDEKIEQLVKAADKLSAYIQCLEEIKAGNSEFRRAAEQIRENLDQMALPELDYFEQHFMDSFSLTLDELE